MPVDFPDALSRRISRSTSLDVGDNVVVDPLDDESYQTRQLGDIYPVTARVVLQALSVSERAQLMQFFKDNRAQLVNITLEGRIYQGYFAGKWRESMSGRVYEVSRRFECQEL